MTAIDRLAFAFGSGMVLGFAVYLITGFSIFDWHWWAFFVPGVLLLLTA